MPGFDGTGPLGQGPMTGRGHGFCVLTTSEESPDEVKGFAGLQSVPVGQKVKNFENIGKKVISMPVGDGTGPAGAGPMTGRAAGFCAGYPLPGYMNPVAGRAGFYGASMPAVGPYGAGYGMPYGNRFRRGFGFGRGFGQGRGWGRGRGRGRFGFRW
ncbi:MAG: DUF5320 domain-containing protein [Sedimentisphaerales bacterium]|nr:DUF5320 domain-containing protein [Sedimentisphaerales bacterium]